MYSPTRAQRLQAAPEEHRALREARGPAQLLADPRRPQPGRFGTPLRRKPATILRIGSVWVLLTVVIPFGQSPHQEAAATALADLALASFGSPVTPPHQGLGGTPRARSHCRFVPPLIHFIPDSLTNLVPRFLKRQCDRTLPPGGPPWPRVLGRGRAGAGRGRTGATSHWR